MSDLKDKIDEALSVDVQQVIKDAEEEVNEMDDAQIEKYNERRKEIDQLKNSLKVARSMQDRDWAESILKNSTDKMIISQAIFTQEIEDDPCSKNITALGELSNALANTVNAVLDIEREERKLAQNDKKIELRAKEVEIASGGVLDANKGENFIGAGTGQDVIAMLRAQGLRQEGEKDAETNEERKDER